MKLTKTLNSLAVGVVLVLCPVAASAQDGASSGGMLEGGVSYTEAPMLQGGASYDEPAPVLKAETPLYDNSLTGGGPSPVLDDQGGIDPATATSSRWTSADCWGVILPSSGSNAGEGYDDSDTSTGYSANCWGVVLGSSDRDSEPTYRQPLTRDEAERAITGTGSGPNTLGIDLINVNLNIAFINIQDSTGFAVDTVGGRALTNTFKIGWSTTLLGAGLNAGVSASTGNLDSNKGWSNYAGADAGELVQVGVDKTFGSGDGWAANGGVGVGIGLIPGVDLHRGASYTNMLKF